MKELEVYLVDPGNNDLGDSLGITQERVKELQEVFRDAMHEEEDGNVASGIIAVSKVVTSPNELAMICYSAGWNLATEDAKEEQEVRTLTQLLKEHLGGDVDVQVHKLKPGEQPPENLE